MILSLKQSNTFSDCKSKGIRKTFQNIEPWPAEVDHTHNEGWDTKYALQGEQPCTETEPVSTNKSLQSSSNFPRHWYPTPSFSRVNPFTIITIHSTSMYHKCILQKCVMDVGLMENTQNKGANVQGRAVMNLGKVDPQLMTGGWPHLVQATDSGNILFNSGLLW